VTARRAFVSFAFIGSIALHLGVFVGASRFMSDVKRNPDSTPIKVRLAEPPKMLRQAAPTQVPVPPTQPKPRPPVRTDRRQPPPETPRPQPEVRAGLSDSLAKPGTVSETAPAVAVGNSSLAEVKPEDANKPPPPPLSGPDVESESVVEAIADTPARCPLPPNLELTTDALNAGLTNAEVVIEVAVSAVGKVRDAKLKSGTGYEIDRIALQAALKLKCSPAVLSGKAVAVAGKKLVWKVMYD